MELENIKVEKIYKVINNKTNCGAYNNSKGAFIKITEFTATGDFKYNVLDKDKKETGRYCFGCFTPEDIEPLNNQKLNKLNKTVKTTMQKLTSILKRVLNKDLQAQYKAEYRDENLKLTVKGQTALLELLAVDKEKELGDLAQNEIKEEEEK